MALDEQTLMEYIKKNDAKSEATLEALQNVYGVMQKQESRYTAEEEDRKKKEEEEKLEKSRMDEASRWDSVAKSMTESITKNVTEAVTKAFQGMDVDGKTPHKVDGGDVSIPQNDKWPASKRTVQEDIEVPAKLRTATSEVQKPIQAMHEGVPHEEPVVPPMTPVMEKVEEYPVEETEGQAQPLDMASLEAMISRLLDEKLVNVQKSTDKKIGRFEDLLKKSGIREEKGLAGPKLTSLSLGVPTNGKTEVTPIVKSENVSPDGITDEMVKNASFRDITTLWAESKGLNKR